MAVVAAVKHSSPKSAGPQGIGSNRHIQQKEAL